MVGRLHSRTYVAASPGGIVVDRPFQAGTLARPVSAQGIEILSELLTGRRTVVLSGAGCSTESGIPDYRGPSGTLRHRTPMRFQEFAGSETARRRYWARSMVGWPRFKEARPNAAHAALARLEQDGVVGGVITQNVDGLHQAAGSVSVVELHGSLARVRCLTCDRLETRSEIQTRLAEMNPVFAPDVMSAAPDGDAHLAPDVEASFRVPSCPCGGVLKPDVVFFGESVPKDWLQRSWDLFDEADVLLVAGSSLEVFSGRRFVLRATERGMPIAIVNLGVTRCDAEAQVRIEGRLGEVLSFLAGSGTCAPARVPALRAR